MSRLTLKTKIIATVLVLTFCLAGNCNTPCSIHVGDFIAGAEAAEGAAVAIIGGIIAVLPTDDQAAATADLLKVEDAFNDAIAALQAAAAGANDYCLGDWQMLGTAIEMVIQDIINLIETLEGEETDASTGKVTAAVVSTTSSTLSDVEKDLDALKVMNGGK